MWSIAFASVFQLKFTAGLSDRQLGRRAGTTGKLARGELELVSSSSLPTLVSKEVTLRGSWHPSLWSRHALCPGLREAGAREL